MSDLTDSQKKTEIQNLLGTGAKRFIHEPGGRKETEFNSVNQQLQALELIKRRLEGRGSNIFLSVKTEFSKNL